MPRAHARPGTVKGGQGAPEFMAGRSSSGGRLGLQMKSATEARGGEGARWGASPAHQDCRGGVDEAGGAEEQRQSLAGVAAAEGDFLTRAWAPVDLSSN